MSSDNKVEFLDSLPEQTPPGTEAVLVELNKQDQEKAESTQKVDEAEAKTVSEPAPEPKAKRASPTKKAAKPEVVADEPVETKEVDTSIAEAKKPQVTKAEALEKETRVTKAIDGKGTEPELVEHDKAFDLETQQTPAIDGKPELEGPPAEVDQPKIDGVSKDTDTRVTAYIEEGETEPKPVKHEETFAEDHHDQPNPGKVGGEPSEDPYLDAAVTDEAEKPKASKAKTTNPKLKRLSKYKD